MSYTNIRLTERLLLEPQEFLQDLRNPQFINENYDRLVMWMNSNEQSRTWYSPPPTQLYYLVGNLKKNYPGEYFGKGQSISENLGIDLFHEFMRYKPDLTICNYYGDTLLDLIKDSKYVNYITTRINNKKFETHILDYYKTHVLN